MEIPIDAYWQESKGDVVVTSGKTLIFPRSFIICQKGGVIGFLDSGQVDSKGILIMPSGIVIPNIVYGIVNGEEKEIYVQENWGHAGGGGYKDPLKDEQGRYRIAVGPKILVPDYRDNGKLWSEDVGINKDTKVYPTIQIVLKNKETGESRTLTCAVVDLKAHSYSKYPDGQSYDSGDTGAFDVENGLVQTGIAYPNSWNAGKNLAFSEEHMTGNVIEFATSDELDFKPSEYILEEIIVSNN